MIYTVTFNPSLDYIVSVKDFKLGLTNRTNPSAVLSIPRFLRTMDTLIPFPPGSISSESVRLVRQRLGSWPGSPAKRS